MTTYTHGHQESVLRSHRWRTAENSCGYLLPHLRADMTLLDVGCGPATITADLATRVASVRGIDPSASVIAEARRDFPDLDLAVGDLFEETGHWDVAHAHQVLQHLSDPVGALRTLASLADLVAVRDSDYSAFTWAPEDASLTRWLEIYLAVTRRNGAEANAGRHLLRWANEAGLTDVTHTWSVWAFATPEDRTWWCGVWADRCLDSSFAQQAVDYGISTAPELSSIAHAWREWAKDDDAVFVVPSGELLARTLSR
jgi:SAM-dependent methyltransferase